MTGPFDAVIEQYGDHEEVAQFLEHLREFTLENVELFRGARWAAERGAGAGVAAAAQPDPFLAFRVNVFVDNSQAAGPPIIVEPNPTWTNLFGRIDRRAYLGTYLSDHTMLKPGAVAPRQRRLPDPQPGGRAHQARRLGRPQAADPHEGGPPGGPDGAVRPALAPGAAAGADPGGPEAGRHRRPAGLLPALRLRRGVLGDVQGEGGLRLPDPADAGERPSPTPASSAPSASARSCATSTARPWRALSSTAAASVDDQEKLSARFGRCATSIVEADYWAGQAGQRPSCAAEHVERAIGERVYR